MSAEEKAQNSAATIMGWVAGLFFAPIIFSGRIQAWLLRFFWKKQEKEQREGRGFNWVIGVAQLVILLGHIFFWFWIFNCHHRWLAKAGQIDAIVKYLPGLSRHLTGWQNSLDRTFLIIIRLDIWSLRRMGPFWPALPLYLLMFNPIVEVSMIYYLLKPRHPFHAKLKAYDYKLPKLSLQKEYERTKNGYNKKGIKITYLGHDFKFNRPAIILDEDRFRHVQVLGSTGSGKTHYVLLPMMSQDIQKNRGIIFVDAKGDINTIKEVYELAKMHGRENDFLLFSMTHPELSNTYNPLLLGNATQLKDKIIGSMHWTEPHYKRECENGLQILFDEHLKKNKTITIKQLNEILKSPPSKYTEFARFYETHKKNITGIQNEINLLTTTPFSYLFDGAEINLHEVYKTNKIVYFAIDTLVYGETGQRIGRLITGDINALCGIVQATHERHELAIYIDEYKSFGTESFTNTLARGRSAGFMVTISHQSAGDLRAISETHAVQVRANTNTRIVLRTNDPETEQIFCDEIGTKRTTELTEKVDTTLGPQGVGEGSLRVVDEYIINPQELRNLDVGIAAYKTPRGYGLLMLPSLFLRTDETILPEKPRPAELKPPEEDETKPAPKTKELPKSVF